jgi:Family of unknown function (DUF5709)
MTNPEPRDSAADDVEGGLEDAEPPEDEVLDADDTLETDDLSADPLDTGISPPERHPASERFGVTGAEAREGESLDVRLAQEEPDIPAVEPSDEAEPRTGRLVSEDEGAHDVSQQEPRQFAEDVGRDGGAASAEEAAVHLVPDEDRPVAIPDEGNSMVVPDDARHVVMPDDDRPVGQSDQAEEDTEE